MKDTAAFTDRSEGSIPGSGLFILVRKGFVSWIAQEDAPPPPKACLNGSSDRERSYDKLVNLLATIAIGGADNWTFQEKSSQNISPGPDMSISGSPQPTR